MIARTASPGNLRLVFVLSLAAVAGFGCSKAEPTKGEILSRANDALAAEQYDKAEKDYREVLRLDPADPVALPRLALVYEGQGELIQAYPLLKKSAELQPDNLEVQLKFGLANLAIHEYAQARDAAQQILGKQPGHEQALLLLAYTAFAPEEIAETRKLVESLRAQDQDRAGYHLALGVLDLRQKDEARAESEFKTALALDPKSSAAYAGLGMLYWSRNDLKAAEQDFKTAAELSPLRSAMRLHYVDFKLRTGAVAEAKALVEDISSKAPDFLPPRVYLMKIACTEHQDDDCAARVQNILAQDPINYDAVFQDGLLSLAKGDAAKAIREFEYLSNTYGRNPQVRYQLALAYLLFAKDANPVNSRNAVDSAESRLSEAITLDPHFEPAILLFAELKIRKGNPASAIDSLVPLIKDRPQSAQAHYLLASAYLALQRRDQALAVYRQMTDLFQKDPQPPFLAGSILMAQGQQPDARKAFETSAGISPDFLPAMEKLVDLDIAEKQYAAALDRVQRQIDKDPKLAQPWAVRAKVYLAQQDFTHGEADLLKAVDLDPKLEGAYMWLAQLYASSNRQDQAIAKLDAFAEQAKTVPTLMLLAMLNERAKHFSEARDAYEKLLTVSPNFSPALNNLAVLYSEHLGQPDKAYDLAKKAKEAAPNDAHTADTLGWIQFKKGDYGDALRLLQEGAAKLADSPEVQFHVGMAQYMLGDEGARLALQKAADASADFPGREEARQRLALLAINAGTADSAARAELEKFLRERPSDPAALVRLAQVQARDGAVDQAVKTYEKVVADNPLYAPATRQLALLYGQRSTNDPKAFDLVQKARQSYPDDPDIAKALGILNYRREFYPRASELLKEAAAKRKDDPELLYYLGSAHQQLKQWSDCKETLERALSLNLSSGLADKAKQALADCSEALPPQ
jgi:tetratricopeptide (TPR) repeat protein